MKRLLAWIAIGTMSASITAFADTVKYSYDALGRITKAEYSSGKVINYTYDKSGRLTSREVIAPSPPPPPDGKADPKAAKEN
jgi:YD repeat-containing protein